jgi:hypothetical protein
MPNISHGPISFKISLKAKSKPWRSRVKNPEGLLFT